MQRRRSTEIDGAAQVGGKTAEIRNPHIIVIPGAGGATGTGALSAAVDGDDFVALLDSAGEEATLDLSKEWDQFTVTGTFSRIKVDGNNFELLVASDD